MRMDNPVRDKSFKFALRIVRLYRHLKEEKKEYVLSKQVLRSGTAIGALIRESQYAESTADGSPGFMVISLAYWNWRS